MPSMFGGVPLDDNLAQSALSQPPVGGSKFGGIPLGDAEEDKNPSVLKDLATAFAKNPYDFTLAGAAKNAGTALFNTAKQGFDIAKEGVGQELATTARPDLASDINAVANERSEKYFPNMAAVQKKGFSAATGPEDVGSVMEAPFTGPIGKMALGGVMMTPLGAAVGTGLGKVNELGEKYARVPHQYSQAAEALLPFAKPAAEVAITPIKAMGEGIGNRSKGAFGTMSPEELDATSDKNWRTSNDSFKDSRTAGAALTPQAGQSVVANVKNAISQAGILNPSRHSDTLAALSDLEKDADAGNLTLDKLDDHRQAFGEAISDNTKSKIDGGGLNSDGMRANLAKKAIVDSISNFGQGDFSSGSPAAASSLLEGINQWAKAARFDRIADIIKKADGDTNAIKSGFKRFTDNENNKRGYSDDEWAAFKDAAQRGTLETLERGLGTFGLDLGKSKNVALPVFLGGNATKGAAAALLPHGLPLAVAGTLLRQSGKYAARGKAQGAIDAVMSRDTTPNNSPTPSSPTVPPVPSNLTPNIKAAALPVSAIGQAQEQLKQPAAPVQPIPQQPAVQPQASTPDVQSFAKAESNNNPNAKNPNSTASGLMQFTNKTWADMVSKYGQITGIKLSDKSNPQAQRIMAAKYAEDNVQSLQNTLGRMPDKGELYIAHVLGPTGAAKLINAQGSGKEAIMLYPRQVFDANRGIFFDGKNPRTVEQVYQLLKNKVT